MAKNAFLEKYRHMSWSLVLKFVAKYPMFRYVEDDLQSAVFSETMNILETFSTDKGNFYPYWRKISIRNINKYIDENRILIEAKNNVISLDCFWGVESKSLHDVIGVEDTTASDNLLSENLIKIAMNPSSNLSFKEQMVIKYYLDGYDFKEIASITHWSLSGIYKFYKSAVSKIGVVLNGPKR